MCGFSLQNNQNQHSSPCQICKCISVKLQGLKTSAYIEGRWQIDQNTGLSVLNRMQNIQEIVLAMLYLMMQ
ncbi:unnamed protein product [Paramecium octaurelia]|uniref:Uncharacterized protein n=1 Tax=Paramecium octaurelia TaxID=43137 RepID=A0A8S1XH09_PAROT|nr:unnamed protein product [Paramecium octaurelia]